jgi:hypothetical protein
MRQIVRKKLPVWVWAIIVCLIVSILGLVDWLTGFELNFFVFYFLPVSLAAWFLGFGASMAVAVLCAMVWSGADLLSGHIYSSHLYAVWNTMVRLVSFLSIGGALSRIRYLLDREQKLAEDLQRSLSEVRVLESFLPICCQCKKIRDKEGHWQQFETYIGQRTDTQFSHGYCPECAKKAMAEAGLISE